MIKEQKPGLPSADVCRRGRKRACSSRTPMSVPLPLNDLWSTAFLADTFGASRWLRILSTNDYACRDNLRLYGKLICIVSDKGTEFISRAIRKWAGEDWVEWHYIDPGKPEQKAFIGSLKGSLRFRLLDEELFDSLAEARRKPAVWRYGFKNANRHSLVGKHRHKLAASSCETEALHSKCMCRWGITNIKPADFRCDHRTSGGQVTLNATTPMNGPTYGSLSA